MQNNCNKSALWKNSECHYVSFRSLKRSKGLCSAPKEMFNSLLQVEKKACLCFCWYFAWRLIFSSPPDLHKNKFIWKELTVTGCVALSFLKGIGNGWGLNNMSVWGQCAFWFLPCQIPSWSLGRWREIACIRCCLKQVLKVGFVLFMLLSVNFRRFVKGQSAIHFLKTTMMTTTNKRP